MATEQSDEVLIIVVIDNKVTALRSNKSTLTNFLNSVNTAEKAKPEVSSLNLFTTDAIKADAKFN